MIERLALDGTGTGQGVDVLSPYQVFQAVLSGLVIIVIPRCLGKILANFITRPHLIEYKRVIQDTGGESGIRNYIRVEST